MSAGLFRFDAGTSGEFAYDWGDEILYLMEGMMEVKFEGQTFTVNAGDFIYFSWEVTL